MANVKYQLLKVMAICWWVVVSGIWILGSLGAIATPARAESKQIDLTLSSYGNQTFTSLIQQAELLAESYVNQAFADSETTGVSVRILGERNGEQVSLLSVTVSRSGWQRKPIIQAWTKYYSNSELLLGFLQHQEPQLATLQPAVVNEGAKETAGSHQEPNFYK